MIEEASPAMPPASRSLKNSVVTLFGAGLPWAFAGEPNADGIMKPSLELASLQAVEFIPL